MKCYFSASFPEHSIHRMHQSIFFQFLPLPSLPKIVNSSRRTVGPFSTTDLTKKCISLVAAIAGGIKLHLPTKARAAAAARTTYSDSINDRLRSTKQPDI